MINSFFLSISGQILEIGEETSNDEIREIYFAFFRETDESAGFVFSGYISRNARERHHFIENFLNVVAEYGKRKIRCDKPGR